MSQGDKKGRRGPAATGGPWDSSGPWVAEGEDSDADEASGPGEPIPIDNPVLGRSSRRKASRPAPARHTTGGYTQVLKRAREALRHGATGDLTTVPNPPSPEASRPKEVLKSSDSKNSPRAADQWATADTICADTQPKSDAKSLQAEIDSLTTKLRETQQQLALVLAKTKGQVGEAVWEASTTVVTQQLDPEND